MANPWFRLWGDMINDPKWRTIARVSGQKIGDVVATYVHMMTLASNATDRGRTEGWKDEDIATALDIDTEQVAAIRNAMQGRVLDGDYLTGWEKRQPKREDDPSKDRVAEHRASKKLVEVQAKLDEVLARVAKGNADLVDVTQCNAKKRNVTPEEIREEEIRQEQKLKAEEEAEALRKAMAATPSAPPADEVAFEFPLNDGSKFPLLKVQQSEFAELYPSVNVDQELRACLGWSIANPTRRKTKSGIMRHINSWLAEKQNKPLGGQPRASPSGGYQTANDKARTLADALTGRLKNEQPRTILDINPAPSRCLD